MEHLIMQFSPTSCHFIPLLFKYSPRHVFTGTLNLWSWLDVKRSSLTAIENYRRNYSFVYFIFKFLNSKREDERL
jgi:hypothetical protein